MLDDDLHHIFIPTAADAEDGPIVAVAAEVAVEAAAAALPKMSGGMSSNKGKCALSKGVGLSVHTVIT